MKDFTETWSGRIPPLLWNVIIVVSAIVIGLVVKTIVKTILNYNKKYTGYSLFRSFILHLSRPMNHFVPILTLNLMVPLMTLDPQYKLMLSRTVGIALMVSFAVVLISAISIFEDYIYHTYDLNKEDNLKERKIQTQIQFIRKLLGALIVFITIALILLSFDNVRKI
ncbi:MAG: mechanosensitive ion channel family protein, partial [Mucilaginibacter sp.]